MLHFSKFKILGISLVLAIGVLFALPNVVPAMRAIDFALVPSKTMNLGLDLQGGSHLLLEVDTRTIEQEKLQSLVSDIRTGLRSARIGYTGLGIVNDNVRVTIRAGKNQQAARDILNALNTPTASGLLVGAGNNTNELTITLIDDVTYQIALNEEARAFRNSRAVQQSIEIIRRRIDELGTTEPSIQRQGERRVLVQVPGLDNPERLKALLGQTAKLNFHLLDPDVSAFEVESGARLPVGAHILRDDAGTPYLVKRRVMVSGERLVDANMGFDPVTGSPEVNFRFDAAGGKIFGDVTSANVGRPFAIVLDGRVISAPVIQSAILGGSGRITGNFTTQEANDLAILLRAGALPAPMEILEERTVGASLGADSVEAGRLALIVGFLAVIIFMVVSYNIFGLFATIALIINLILIMAALSALQATLTLPGIAGIVLTVGMAVDANVLIFERIREEFATDNKVLLAIDKGYERALGTILDANITTFLAALILFQLGSGPVRGFAVTLAIGIVTSVFTAFVVTRLFVAIWVRRSAQRTVLPI